MRPASGIVCFLLALGLAAPAAAQSPEAGTHFLFQATGGVTLTRTGTFGALLGAGGRVGKVRLYALFEATWATGQATGTSSTGPWAASLNGADLAGGVRVFVPITEVVRVYVDALGGGTLASFSLTRAGQCPRSSFGRDGLFDLAGGLDLRLMREFSLGVRAKVHVVDATPGWLSALSVDLARNADLTAGMTFHF